MRSLARLAAGRGGSRRQRRMPAGRPATSNVRAQIPTDPPDAAGIFRVRAPDQTVAFSRGATMRDGTEACP